MCVAILVEGPDISSVNLRAMEIDNPHGAGLAWPDGDVIRFRKGLTWQEVRDLQSRLPRPFLLHFRWATHGPKVKRLTHPFVLGPRAFSRSLTGSASAVLIHNGVWTDYRRHLPTGIKDEGVSDTQVAAYVAETDESILDEVDWATAIGRAAGGGRMDVTLRGRWYEHDGNQYSNFNWMPSSTYAKPRRPIYDPSDYTEYTYDPRVWADYGKAYKIVPGQTTELRNRDCTRCGCTIGHLRGCPNSIAERKKARMRNDDKAYEQWLADHARVQAQLNSATDIEGD